MIFIFFVIVIFSLWLRLMTEFAIIFFLKYSSAQVGEHEKHGWTISRLEDHPNSST